MNLRCARCVDAEYTQFWLRAYAELLRVVAMGIVVISITPHSRWMTDARLDGLYG